MNPPLDFSSSCDILAKPPSTPTHRSARGIPRKTARDEHHREITADAIISADPRGDYDFAQAAQHARRSACRSLLRGSASNRRPATNRPKRYSGNIICLRQRIDRYSDQFDQQTRADAVGIRSTPGSCGSCDQVPSVHCDDGNASPGTGAANIARKSVALGKTMSARTAAAGRRHQFLFRKTSRRRRTSSPLLALHCIAQFGCLAAGHYLPFFAASRRWASYGVALISWSSNSKYRYSAACAARRLGYEVSYHFP